MGRGEGVGKESPPSSPSREHSTPARRREAFERTFRATEQEATFDSVLARIRAGHWETPTSLARYFGKEYSWTKSLMCCGIREQAVADYPTWRSYFTQHPRLPRPITATTTPPHTPVPFRVPPLDGEREDAY